VFDENPPPPGTHARSKTSYLEIADITAGSAEADKTLGHRI
jgi:hypothetical protein